MATTTNFGWETPDDTDLVKDGAAAIRTALSGVDTSFVDLKGGTTGQVLAKASNTDLDFVWSADASGIPATIFDAKGDIIAATAADTAARLAVGTNGQVLTADSTAATGLKWASASANKSYTLLNTGGTALTGASTITVSGISGVDNLMIIVVQASADASSNFDIRFNADSGAKYFYGGIQEEKGSAFTAITPNPSGQTSIFYCVQGNNAGNTVSGYINVLGAAGSGSKAFNLQAAGTGTLAYQTNTGGVYTGTSAISSVSIISSVGNFDAGSIYIYGA